MTAEKHPGGGAFITDSWVAVLYKKLLPGFGASVAFLRLCPFDVRGKEWYNTIVNNLIY